MAQPLPPNKKATPCLTSGSLDFLKYLMIFLSLVIHVCLLSVLYYCGVYAAIQGLF